MTFDTHEERLESTERIMAEAKDEIAEIKLAIRNHYENKKGLEILYLNVFYNVSDEEFEIYGILTFFGRVFWVSKANNIISRVIFVDEFLADVNDWIRYYTIKRRVASNLPRNQAKRAEYPRGFVHVNDGEGLDLNEYVEDVEAAPDINHAPHRRNAIAPGPAEIAPEPPEEVAQPINVGHAHWQGRQYFNNHDNIVQAGGQ